MSQETIQTLFNDSIQTQVATADSLGDIIESATSKLVAALLNGNRVFSCGDDSSQFVAAHFAELLVHGSELERPPFPAIHLVSQARDSVNQECFSRQVSALGQERDVLVVFVSQKQSESLHQAMTAAVSRDMQIITITGEDAGEITGLLGPNDMEVRIPSNSRARIVEQQLFLSQTFCDLIENQIFGGM